LTVRKKILFSLTLVALILAVVLSSGDSSPDTEVAQTIPAGDASAPTTSAPLSPNPSASTAPVATATEPADERVDEVVPAAPVVDFAAPLLDAPATQVADAIATVGLDVIAERNPQLTAEKIAEMADDTTLHVDRYGFLFFIDTKEGNHDDHGEESEGSDDPVRNRKLSPPVNSQGGVSAQSANETLFPVDVFDLSSRPGANRTIYLDFDGGVITDTAWNLEEGPLVAAPYDTDGSPTTFNASERAEIYNTWMEVAEDFAPFDVNVTTKDPGFAAIDRADQNDQRYGTRVQITQAYGETYERVCGYCGGVAYVGVFNTTFMHSYFQPAWSFTTSSRTISHEAGHNLGLSHDGQNSDEYYFGHGNWVPIMGSSWNLISQFSRGEYAGATQTEDDFVVMQQTGAPLRADDYPNTVATAQAVNLSTGSISGVIHTRTDVDAFKVTLPSGSVVFTASPVSNGANLDIRLELRSTDGQLVASNDPASSSLFDWNGIVEGMGATVRATVSAGTYVLLVDGVGRGTVNNGYSDYGSVGAYTLKAGEPQLTVQRWGADGGKITSFPAGLDCPSTCTASFNAGTAVTLNSSIVNGFGLAQWKNMCSGTECFFNVDQDRTLNGVMTSPRTVKVNVVGSGSVFSIPGDIRCGAAYFFQVCETTVIGDIELYTSTESDDWVFQSFSGPCADQNYSCVLSYLNGGEITVTFAPAKTLTVYYNDGFFAIDPDCWAFADDNKIDCVYPAGQEVTLFPIDKQNERFAGWSGACVGTGLCTVTLDTNLSVTLHYGVAPVTQPGAPAAPSLTVGDGRVALGWPTPFTGNSPITSYRVQYRSGGGAWTDGPVVTTPGAVVAVTNGNAYQFRVAATNAIGTGQYSAPSVTVTPAAPPGGVCGLPITKVSDVPAGTYFEQPVSCMSQRRIATADPFRPSSSVTRAEMAVQLWRAANLPDAPASCGFSDEAQIPAWARQATCWLKAEGITTNNPYRPSGQVTRAEMSAFLWRFANKPAALTACGFSDQAQIPAYARQATCWLKAERITTNNPYRPASPVTRAELATFLFRTGGTLNMWPVR
jgi:hypothetical protein